MNHIDPTVQNRIDASYNHGQAQLDSGIHEAFARCLFCRKKITNFWKNKNREYCNDRCKRLARKTRGSREISQM